jgi:HEAT repeat protein
LLTALALRLSLVASAVIACLSSSAFAQGGPNTSDAPTTRRAATATGPIEENLLLILGQNTPMARQVGAARLLDIGSDEAIGQLQTILSDPKSDSASRLAIAAALAQLDSPPPALIDALLPLLGDREPALSDAVIRALSQYDGELLVGRLRPVALDASRNRATRQAAIEALGELGNDVRAIDVLATLLSDADRSIRASALTAFNEMTGADAKDVSAGQEWWQQRTAKSPTEMIKAINRSRVAKIRGLRKEREVLTRRLVASTREKYLAMPDPQRPVYLLTILTDDLAAIRALGLEFVNLLITDRREIGPDIRQRVAALINDNDPQVRLLAARRVGDLRLTDATSRLADAVVRESRVAVRAAQVAALGRLDDASVLGILEDRLHDEEAEVITEAATALGTLARPARGDADVTRRVAGILAERLGNLPAAEIELRSRLLTAMTGMTMPELRPVFEEAAGPGTATPVRQAAMAALAAFSDARAASVIRPMLDEPDAAIRLAAVDAWSRCAQTAEDLDLLTQHLESDREPDAEVRARAWSSLQSAFARLPPDRQIMITDRFDRAEDAAAQRRRFDLLKAMREDAARFDQLPPDMRLAIVERTANAQAALREYPAAAAVYEQAAGLAADDDRSAALRVQALRSILAAGDDAAALKKAGDWVDGSADNGEIGDASLIADLLSEAVKARLAVASDGPSYRITLGLIDHAGQWADSRSMKLVSELSDWRREAVDRRTSDIDELLDGLARDPAAEGRLLTFDADIVLERIIEQLASPLTTSGPATDHEARLVQLARRMMPEWDGFNGSSSEASQQESLAALRALIDDYRKKKAVSGSAP